MGRKVIAFIGSAVLATVAGCSSPAAPPAQTVTVTQPPSTTIAAPVPTAVQSLPPTAETAPAPSSWTMPDLIGKDLQAAQDAVQSVTQNPAFYSSSTDLSGQGRAQIMDRNWQVCTSSPPPGEVFSEGTPVEFGVVRDSETCP